MPLAFVAAVPTNVLFSVKLIVLPAMTALVLAFRSVADRFTVPPKGPVAGSTVSVVAGRVLIDSGVLPELAACAAPPW
jgi:hypothetical protein